MFVNNNLGSFLVSFDEDGHLKDEHITALIMKTIFTNQEILLLPGSSFFNRECCEKDEQPNTKQLSQKEKVINLCWNGILPELLPEIAETDAKEKALTLWEVNETDCLLDLRLGEANNNLSDAWSINPYIFLEFAEMN